MVYNNNHLQLYPEKYIQIWPIFSLFCICYKNPYLKYQQFYYNSICLNQTVYLTSSFVPLSDRILFFWRIFDPLLPWYLAVKIVEKAMISSASSCSSDLNLGESMTMILAPYFVKSQ